MEKAGFRVACRRVKTPSEKKEIKVKKLKNDSATLMLMLMLMSSHKIHELCICCWRQKAKAKIFFRLHLSLFFLVADTLLDKRLCPTVILSVGLWVRNDESKIEAGSPTFGTTLVGN